MKKNMILLLVAAAVAGCSGNEDIEPVDEARVPIELNAGVAAYSKAPIEPGGNTTMKNIGIAGWESESTDSKAVDFKNKYNWHTHLSVTASTTEQGVEWLEHQYYNATAKVNTYMKAWYPCGDFKDSPITEEGKVSFDNPNGAVDVMMADVVYGNKATPVTQPLTFKHKTAQIRFKVKKGDGMPDNVTISRIRIKSVQRPIGFDITKGVTDAEAITYADAADLEVPNVNTAQVITETATAVGDPVMIRPKSANTFLVDVTTSETTYSDCTVTLTGEASMTAGYAYTITLSFGHTGLTLTAKVDAWQSGTGSANLQ